MRLGRGSWLALAAVVVVAGACGGGDKTIKTSETSTTTSTTEPTTTTTTIAVPATTTTTKKVVTAKEKKCVSATSQATPSEPDNQPMTIDICIDDVTPAPGQFLTLTVTADDPDALIGEGQCDIYVNWEGDAHQLCRDFIIAGDAEHPQRVPQHGHRVKTFDHVYTDAGDYTVTVIVWSGPGDGHPDPYDNSATAEIKLSVKSR